jgi:signal transduction histidine kinase
MRTLPLTAAFVLIGGVLAWMVGNRVTRPMRQMANAAIAIGAGDYQRRVRVREGGDLGMMASAFNRMAADLSRHHAELDERVRMRTAELELVNNELQAFSYSVSHDLRSPLRSIDGFSQALLEDYRDKLDATGQDYLRRLRGGAQRMGQLIDDLLLLSRVTRQPLQAVPVNISALATELVEELREQDSSRNVKVDIEEALVVKADYGLMRIALQNLIGNAWKFTQNQADASITVGVAAVEDERAGEAENVLYVKDNGAGFDMAYAKQLFAPFQRLHSSAEFAGTGIGLATVQRVIMRHGGRVWADAAVGRGATFFFTLGKA